MGCCQVPDYRDLIKHPMDFATMRRKVDLQAYRTVDDIAADFQLMISNCMTYNAKTTIFYRAAVKMMNQVRRLLLHVVHIISLPSPRCLARGEGKIIPEIGEYK